MEKFVTLNNGIKMPRLGFGVYQIDDLAQAQQVVEDGLEVGYRLVDTAQIYGNEQAVGDAIKHSNVPREDIFITSKIWVDDYGYDNTLKAFDDSMKKLQLDYIDLYLIHKPYNDQTITALGVHLSAYTKKVASVRLGSAAFGMNVLLT